MLQILHITDSHIGETKREAVNLVKVVNYIMDHFFDDRDHTVIIHTGDVVDGVDGYLALMGYIHCWSR